MADRRAYQDDSSWDDYPGNNGSSFVTGFNVPPSSPQVQPHGAARSGCLSTENMNGRHQQSPPLLPVVHSKKAAKHRKRHVPVGPAGVWFQNQQQQHQQLTRKRRRKDKNDHSEEASLLAFREDDDDDDEDLNAPDSPPHDRDINDHNVPSAVKARRSVAAAFYSPAWTAAQCSLRLATPSCPAYWSTLQKYALIKKHLPENYLLLSDILAGNSDWKMRPQQKLLAQVVSVNSITSNDRLWTVTLQDETGCTMTAWMQPSFVRTEQQQQTKYSRPGYVWLLSNCTIQLVVADATMITTTNNNNNNDDNGDDNSSSSCDGDYHGNNNHNSNRTVDRMLLISERNIQQVWSSSSADQISNADYIHWMEARNSLTASLLQEQSSSGSGEDAMQAAQPDNNGPSTDHGLPTALFVLPPSQQQKRVETASATRLQQTPVNYNYSRQQHVVHPQQHLPRPVTTTGHASTASQFSVATTPGNHPPLVSGTSLESQRVPHQRVLPRTAPALAHTVGRGGVILSDASSAVGTQKRALIHSVDRRPSSAIVNSRSISVPVQLPVVVVQERRTANIARYQPALPVTADQQIADVSTSTSLPSTTATNQALSHQPNRSPVPAMMRMMHTPSTILRLHSTSSASSVKNVDFQQLAAPQSLLKETSTTARRLDNTRGGFAGQTANDAIICSNFGQLTDKVSTPLCSQPPHTVVNRSTLTNAKKRKDVARPKKTASGLFSSMNASMLAMFDDDDEENDAPFAFVSRAKQPIIAEEKDPPFHRSIAAPLFTGSSCCKEQDPAIVLANTTASNASLFQSAAFTGLDVDDMFDEDDD